MLAGVIHNNRYAMPMISPQKRFLLIGATGAVGRYVHARLAAGGAAVIALSRQAREPASPSTQWYQHDIYRDDPDAVPSAPVVIGAGPLDGLALWAARATWSAGTRLVALSSLSAETKAESVNDEERALAQRLRDCEATLFALGTGRGWSVTLIRASLIYDSSPAQLSLDRLLALADRLHFLPLPRDAIGLRQPVHADDLAQALLACAANDTTADALLRLAGGEAVAFADMVARFLAARGSVARVVRVPGASARVLQAVLPLFGARGRSLAAQLARSRNGLVIDNSDWSRIGLVPRAFMRSDSSAAQLNSPVQ